MSVKDIAGVFIFIFGTVIGSFLSVLAHRLPQKEDFIKGRSRCPVCSHDLNWKDLFPLFSWIFLGGKCRYCKSRISPRYPLIELVTGISFVFAFFALKNIIAIIITVILFSVLICLSLTDIQTTEIPYWCSGVIAVLGIFSLITSFVKPYLLDVSGSPWYVHIIGALIISGPFAIFCFFGAMGGGDIQLVAAAGLLLGWAIVPAAMIGLISGAIIGTAIKIVEKIKNKDKKLKTQNTSICFGPFLAFGIAVCHLYGYNIINWYQNFLKY